MTTHKEPTHPAGESFTVVFTDKVGTDRTGPSMSGFASKLKSVAEQYGFSVQTWGPTSKVIRSIAPAYMERVLVMREDPQ